MITKMKKITALIYHREYDAFLAELQRLGVVHVQPSQQGSVNPDSSLQAELKNINDVQAAIDALAALTTTANAANGKASDGKEAMAQYEQLLARCKELQAEEARLAALLVQVEPWGDFDPAAIETLNKDTGLEMTFFTTTTKAYQKNEAAWNADGRYTFLIQEHKGSAYFVVIAPDNADVSLDGATRVEMPSMTAAPCRQAIEQVQEKLDDCKKQLSELAGSHLQDLKAYNAQLRTQVQFDKARLDTATVADDTVMILEGWTPVQKEGEVLAFLQQSGVCYEMRNPVKTDNVPILLRNNWFTRMYEVLTEMYGMPDYKEFDPTPIVAPFFTLFFSYCIGDAGYGLVLVMLGFLLKAKMGPSMKGMMNLVITLGIATTVLGAVFGTFFGVQLVDTELPDSVKALMITGKAGDTIYDKTMLLALVIGVIHLVIAMTVKAIKSTVQFGFKQSITPWSWLLLIVGFICAGGLGALEVISSDMTATMFYVIGGVAGVGIFLLNDLKRNPLINIGAGLWDTYGMASGLMGDVLSYVRIYALGLAGGMLGGVFNTLAFMTKGDSWLGWIPCIAILVFGHTLNIAMSCLGAFVHPLRLNFVEYFKNSNYEGSGTAYEPLHVVDVAE